tara:strand:+ start:158 stop:409 length:252 start_codon:yes stop_codon:yes gene_type:complete
MPKGKIGGFAGSSGQILSEGNVYNFHLNNVQGGISNGKEIDFELDELGNVKIIFGDGKPKKKSPKIKKETTNIDTKELLTEEK